MTATRCLFIPIESWGYDDHVSRGIHLRSEYINIILCGCCGAINNTSECVILWEEQKWGSNNPVFEYPVKEVCFDIDNEIYAMTDERYHEMCDK